MQGNSQHSGSSGPIHGSVAFPVMCGVIIIVMRQISTTSGHRGITSHHNSPNTSRLLILFTHRSIAISAWYFCICWLSKSVDCKRKDKGWWGCSVHLPFLGLELIGG